MKLSEGLMKKVVNYNGLNGFNLLLKNCYDEIKRRRWKIWKWGKNKIGVRKKLMDVFRDMN
jgi:hypothetical protein